MDAPQALVDYAEGTTSLAEAMAVLGLSDYHSVLAMLGEHLLMPPRLTDDEREEWTAYYRRELQHRHLQEMLYRREMEQASLRDD